MTPTHAVLFLSTMLLATGCASATNDTSDGGTAATGSAPKISAFTFSRSTIAAGKLETVSGEFMYEDADADVSEFAITIKAGAQSSVLPKGAVVNASGMKSGKAAVAIALQVPQAGPVEVHLAVTDAGGHTSNELVVTLTAQ